MQSELLALARRIDPRVVAVACIERLSGGANNETWAFDAETGDGPLPLILRRTAGGDAAAADAGDPDHATLPPEREAALLQAVAAAGVPVPPVRAVLSPGDALGRGFVMDRLPGETRPKRLLGDPAYAGARAALIGQCGRALAALHAMPLQRLPALRVATARDELALWERRWRAHGGARPAFELALRWLHAHVPDAPTRVAPVHGDFRNGNLLVDADGLRAVLDWELAHAGDPLEDLGWFCVASWRFGAIDAQAGGFGGRQALIDAYCRAGGDADAQRVRYWEVFGTLRWGVMCVGMAHTWRTGRDRSVERVAVARRASETELDLLRLLAPRRGPGAA
jgi:aminoglycoside phosphotransferase (APT) family kinase protein